MRALEQADCLGFLSQFRALGEEFESRLCPIRMQLPPLLGSFSASRSLRSPQPPNHCYPNL